MSTLCSKLTGCYDCLEQDNWVLGLTRTCQLSVVKWVLGLPRTCQLSVVKWVLGLPRTIHLSINQIVTGQSVPIPRLLQTRNKNADLVTLET